MMGLMPTRNAVTHPTPPSLPVREATLDSLVPKPHGRLSPKITVILGEGSAGAACGFELPLDQPSPWGAPLSPQRDNTVGREVLLLLWKEETAP